MDRKGYGSYSTGDYIINKVMMKPIIERLILSDGQSGWVFANLIAGGVDKNGSCTPSHCYTKDGHFRPSIINNCIYAPMGYRADSLIYASAKTYVFTFPLFCGWNWKLLSHASHFNDLRSIIKHFFISSEILPHWIKLHVKY